MDFRDAYNLLERCDRVVNETTLSRWVDPVTRRITHNKVRHVIEWYESDIEAAYGVFDPDGSNGVVVVKSFVRGIPNTRFKGNEARKLFSAGRFIAQG